jgi:predicted DNA-binding protein (UPF0251 family)
MSDANSRTLAMKALPTAQKRLALVYVNDCLKWLKLAAAFRLRTPRKGRRLRRGFSLAVRRLHAPVRELERLIGTPPALRWLLEGSWWNGPEHEAWRTALGEMEQKAQKELEKLRDALTAPNKRRSGRRRKPREELTDKEREAVKAMANHDYNQVKAAAELEISRRALQKRLERAEVVLGKELARSMNPKRQRLPETGIHDPNGPPPPKGRVHRTNRADRND